MDRVIVIREWDYVDENDSEHTLLRVEQLPDMNGDVVDSQTMIAILKEAIRALEAENYDESGDISHG